jgi:hypothetical protein
MRSVSRFEHNLLRLLHFFLRQAPVQQALPLLETKLQRPKCLHRDAIELVKDALGKGCVLLLAHLGGWRKERHLRNDKIVEGRLWERTPPNQLGLPFSRNTLDFLMWITAEKAAEEKQGWRPVAEVTLGDLLLFYFAFEQLRPNDLAANLLKCSPFDTNGLIWLAFPDEHAKASSTSVPDFKPWLGGVGAYILEALQPVLTERWIVMEVEKGNVAGWQQMRDLGQAQERVLNAFLDAVEKAGRYDLARFLLFAARDLVTPRATSDMWVRSLRQHAQRLADRAETYRGAMAFLRQLPRLQQWMRQARSVGYYDEGYQASQLWKADWERFREMYTGHDLEARQESTRADYDDVTERAQTIIRVLDPMRQTEG